MEEEQQTEKTSLFIGNLDPAVTEDQVKQAIRRHLRTRKHILEFKLCLNTSKNKNMAFFVTEDYETTKNLVIRPLFILGVEHYCQICQTWDETQKFDFQEKCLFISNVSYDMKDFELSNFFSNFGKVESCYIVKKNGKSKGYGFVYFKDRDIAQDLLHSGVVNLKGKNIYLRPYKQKTKKETQHNLDHQNTLIDNIGFGNLNFFENYGGNFFNANENMTQNDFIYQLILQNMMLQMQMGNGHQNVNYREENLRGVEQFSQESRLINEQEFGENDVDRSKNTKREIMKISMNNLDENHRYRSGNLRINKA